MQKTALLVDDSRVARITLRKLLIHHDFEVTELSSGEEALSYLQSADTLPDLIFMDVMMDGMDGLTATREIKANTHLAAIPVVICTGNDTEADIENALSTGALAVLAKPPAAAQLAKVLEQVETTTVAVEAVTKPLPPVIEAAPAIDIDAMTRDIIANIEQTMLPNLKQEMRSVADDISRQVAVDAAEQCVADNIKATLDGLMPEVTEQLTVKVTSSTEALAQQVAKQAARDAVAKTAENAVRRTVAEVDLSAQVLQSLSAEGTTWLNSQQHQIESKITQSVTQEINALISDSLEQALEQRVSPLVTKQVNIMLTQLAEKDESEQQLVQLESRIKRLNTMVIGLGVGLVAVSAAAGVLLL